MNYEFKINGTVNTKATNIPIGALWFIKKERENF